MALATGTSRIKTGPLTLHTQTAIKITETLTGADFKISPIDHKGAYLIECKGINFKNKNL
jgi:RNA 3'-terminal phosphate cyclase (ATP)